MESELHKVNVLGIDPSLACTGVALIQATLTPTDTTGSVTSWTLSTPGGRDLSPDMMILDGDRRADELVRAIETLDLPEIHYCYMERPMSMRNSTTSVQLIGAAAVIRSHFRRRGIPIGLVHGATLKAHAGASGLRREAKAQMVALAEEKWGVTLKGAGADDMADAIWLADMALADHRRFLWG